MRRRILLGLAPLLLGGIAAAQPRRRKDAMHRPGHGGNALTATPAFDGHGTLWLARGMPDRVLVAKSTDLGRTFGPEVSATPGPVDMDWGPDSRPQIMFDRSGALLLTYAVFRDKHFNGAVYFTRSTDGGATFTSPRPITSDGTSQRFQQLALTSDGRVFAAWLDKRHAAAAIAAGKPYPGAALAYAWSSDGGQSFGDTHIAFDNTCECCRLAVAIANPDRPVVLFRNIFEGSVRDHAITTFTNSATPGPLRRVSVDNWKIDACPHQGPSLAIAEDGSYHAAWFTDGVARHGLFYARADNDDAPFSEPRALSSPDRQPARSFLLAAGEAVHLVWKEFDGERTLVRWQASRDSGRRWSSTRTVASTDDASDHPLLIARENRAYLSWLTKTEGYRLVPLKDES
jgi:hypothetical protein